MNVQRLEKPPTAREVKRIQQLSRWYCQLGTLQAVGQKAGGLTRERVRQLLSYGRRHGVCRYSPRERCCQRVAQLPVALQTATSLAELARALGYRGKGYGKWFLPLLGIELADVEPRLQANRRRRLVEMFRAGLQQAGIDDASSYQIVRARPELRAVYEQMRREFGSVRQIREALGLPGVDLRVKAERRELETVLRRKAVA